MKTDWLGYILLPTAIVGIFGGIRLASGGTVIGWLGIVVGLVLAVASYWLMMPAPTAPTASAGGPSKEADPS